MFTNLIFYMGKKLRQTLLLLCVLTPMWGQAQTNLHTESFETDGEGTRYVSNTFSFCSGTPGGNPDYFIRTNTNPVLPTGCSTGFGNALTGLQGSFFWAGEDIRSSSPVPSGQPPGQLTTSAISIANYGSLSTSFYLATSNNNGVRWESADSINVQVSIDNGPFRTIGRFMGDGTTGGHLRQDANLDGAITASDPSNICDTLLFTQYTFGIPGTGNSLQVRLDFDQLGGTEESAFDMIEVWGTFLGSPEIHVEGNGNVITDGDTSPTSTDNTDFGSQATCLGVVARTFTIANTGAQPLTISGIVFSGANPSDFAVVTPPSSTVPAAGSTTFTAIFNPTANGFRIATLNILNNDFDEGNYDFTIQGFGLPDTVPPTITCPVDSAVNPAPGQCAAIVNYSPTTQTDNCNAQITVTQLSGLPSGGNFPLGTTVNIFQATDSDGNTATCAYLVTVLDAESPLSICQNDTIFLNSQGQASITPANVDGGSTDNCAIDSMSVSPNTFTSANLGNNNVVLTVVDAMGNPSTCSAVVTVVDSTVAIADPLQGKMRFILAANPAQDHIQVQVECMICESGDDIQLQLWSMHGQLLRTLPLKAEIQRQRIELDMSGLASGNYTLQLRHNGRAMSRQVIKL
jgi:hypothetical protein